MDCYESFVVAFSLTVSPLSRLCIVSAGTCVKRAPDADDAGRELTGLSPDKFPRAKVNSAVSS